MGGRLADLLQLVPGREHVLHRVVVERLGQPPPLSLLGCEGVCEQAGAVVGEPRDELRPSVQQQREEHAGGADPGEVAGLREDEANGLGPSRGWMSERLNEICACRDDHGRARDTRPEAEGDRDRDEEEREPDVGERAAGEDGEHADRGDVDDGRGERESLAGRMQVHPREHARAPGRVHDQRDEEGRLSRIRVREALAQRDQPDRWQAKPRDDALGFGGCVRWGGGGG